MFVVDVTGGTEALKVCDLLRKAGIAADRSYGGRSMKAQMKVADRSGANFAVIIGEDELAAGEVTLRDMGDSSQRRVAQELLIDELIAETDTVMDLSTSMRTHMCGLVGTSDIGSVVTVCGWVDRRREHGEHLVFIDLRDHSGVVQCVVDGSHDLRSEYVVQMTGEVRRRPEDTANPELATGEIEIEISSVEVLSVAEPPPFPLDERTEVDETIRLRHRYVDLRKARMQRNLRIRSRVNSAIRRGMESQGFVEVETPMLMASTPEGARDFVVPSRKEPGSFYALPQRSPAFQATLHGWRYRSLLPDRSLSCAMKTFVLIGSSNSCNSTPKRVLSARMMSSSSSPVPLLKQPRR